MVYHRIELPLCFWSVFHLDKLLGGLQAMANRGKFGGQLDEVL